MLPTPERNQLNTVQAGAGKAAQGKGKGRRPAEIPAAAADLAD